MKLEQFYFLFSYIIFFVEGHSKHEKATANSRHRLSGSNECQTSLDCGLNGNCTESGQCKCDSAWKGPACTQLNLVPVSPEHATSGSYRDRNRTSWGANVFYSSADGLYHMIVAEMKGNCTLTSWIPSSQIVHAVATSPDGPFSFKEVLFDTFHHNPRLVRLPTGGFLLYMIGGNFPVPNKTECQDLPHTEGEDLDTRILVSFSPTLNGPWSPPLGPLLPRGGVQDWDYIVTNPSPVILENGTVLLYYRGTPKYWEGGPRDLPESVGLASAPSWQGPYTRVFDRPILSVMNEDPFVWRDNRGFHMLTHGRDDWWNTHYAWSRDGLQWSDGRAVATDPNVTLSNGNVMRFTNRERPWIYFNETTGKPAILFNGVCPGEKYTYAYTFSQHIVQE